MLQPLETTADDAVPLHVHACATDFPRATAFVLPALGVAPKHYGRFAEALATGGVETFVLEPRAHRRGERPGHGYARRVADAACVIRILSRPGRPRLVVGHSLGAHVAALLAAREPGLVDGLVFAAAGTPRADRFPFGMRSKILVLRAVAALAPAMGYFPGHRLGFGDDESPTLMREWAGIAGNGRFVVDGRDVADELGSVTMPTLSIAIEGDTMAPPAATEDLLARVPRAMIARTNLGPPALPRDACDHVRWLRRPAPIAEAIVAFAEGMR